MPNKKSIIPLNNARAYILLSLLLLLSCSRGAQPVTEGDRIPIRFSCFSGGVEVTKADASFAGSNILADSQHFAVFGWNTGSGYLPQAPNPGTPNFWNGVTPVDVTFHNNNDRGKNNTYDPAALPELTDQYWPRSSDPAYCYSFWAYYPYTGSPNGISLRSFASNPSDGTVGIIDFTVQDEVADMVDFCISDVANDNVYLSFNLYESGIITKRELIRRLKTYKLVDQLLFHTEQSLQTLKYIGNKEVQI